MLELVMIAMMRTPVLVIAEETQTCIIIKESDIPTEGSPDLIDFSDNKFSDKKTIETKIICY